MEALGNLAPEPQAPAARHQALAALVIQARPAPAQHPRPELAPAIKLVAPLAAPLEARAAPAARLELAVAAPTKAARLEAAEAPAARAQAELYRKQLRLSRSICLAD